MMESPERQPPAPCQQVVQHKGQHAPGRVADVVGYKSIQCFAARNLIRPGYFHAPFAQVLD